MTQATRADFLSILSMVADLATGQPLQFSLRSCVMSLRFGEVLGFGRREMTEIYHQALLRFIGCNADTYLMSALFGDEIAFRHDFARIDPANPAEIGKTLMQAIRRSHPAAGGVSAALMVAKGLFRARAEAPPILAGHCEVAAQFALRLGLGPQEADNLGQLYERWDGKGQPRGVKGQAVALPVRLVTLVQDCIILSEAEGLEAAKARIAARRGAAYDPSLVDRFLPVAAQLMADLERINADAALALDPGPAAVLDEAGIDAACLVLADMTDIRMPQTLGHSRAVAALAETAARRMRLSAAEIALVRRAALLHDIGECATPVAVWHRPGAFSQAERGQIELHAYQSERLLRMRPSLAVLADIVGRHHERLDGSGYHRGCRAAELSPASRVVAAAEAFRTATESRPHRPALRPEAAAARLNAAIRAGAICPLAGAAVIEAAGQRALAQGDGRTTLTPRENEVLLHLTSGLTVKGVARALGVSTKTADNHVQNLYGKLGVSTRAAAVLWAVEHGRLPAGRSATAAD